MDIIDVVTQRNFPSIPIPLRGPFTRSEKHGERLLIGSNGIFLEVSRAWCYLVRQIASYSVSTPIPYGEGAEATEFSCGAIPLGLVSEFVRMARQACPLETAAFISWDEKTHEYALHPAKLNVQTDSFLSYDPPQLSRDQHLVIDLHSHGRDRAYYSGEDDSDDETYVKIAIVVGNCDQDEPSYVSRLCAKGIFEILSQGKVCS